MSGFRKKKIYAGFLIVALSYAVSAQTLTVRNAHSMIYDSKKGRTYLFGGADEKMVYGDLWILGKKRWKHAKAKGPEPRTFASFVYDQKLNQAILFGGNGFLFGTDKNRTKMLGDTWRLRSGKWTKIRTSEAPEARAEAASAYDVANKRIILFGGYTKKLGKFVKLGDTWEFKNNKWKKISDNGPSPRNGAVMAFDGNLNGIVLFGGSSSARNKYGKGTGETWILISDRWEKIENDQPANHFNSNMVYDSSSKEILRFGGWNGNKRVNDSMAFRQNIWKRLSFKEIPPARNHSSMVYDSKRKRTILFGGHDGKKIFGDLWIYKNGKWYKQFEHTPIKRLDNGH